MMNRLAIVAAALFAGFAAPLLACPTGTIEIQDNLRSIDGTAWIGSSTQTLNYNPTNSGLTFVGQTLTLKVAAGADGLLDACRVPGVYAVTKTSAASATVGSQSPDSVWVIPTSGGPYKLNDVPTGVVNTTGTSVAWASGINFAIVRKGSTVTIGSFTCTAAAIQSAISMTVSGCSPGNLIGASWNNGAIEQAIPSTPLPVTISGPPGPAVPGTGVVKVTNGVAGLVSGNDSDCVKKDGSSGSCGSGGSAVPGPSDTVPVSNGDGTFKSSTLPVTQSGAASSLVKTDVSGNIAASGAIVSALDSLLHGITAGLGGGGVSTNAAFGLTALYGNSTGSGNAAFGNCAMCFNITGISNAAFGNGALKNNTTGASNTAVGSGALNAATNTVATLAAPVSGSGYVDGTYNNVQLTYLSGTPFSTVAGQSNSYPVANIVVSGGSVSSVTLVNGGQDATDATTVFTAPNSALGGSGSGFSVQVGTLTVSQRNTSVGGSSLGKLLSGSFNTSVGQSALSMLSAGSNNVAVGWRAGQSNLGSGNVFLGSEAGSNETGSNKLYVDDTSTSNPLIGGDFGARTLSFDGHSVLPVEMGYSSGVTSSIQAQLNSKQSALGFTPLNPVNNLSDLGNAAAARGNLGLGGAATLNVGTSTGTVAAGDDSRLSNARTPTAHAASHQNGGSDEIATATPGANAIPKAGAGGTLGTGWLPVIPRSLGGLNSASPGTGILRDGTTPAASELSGDAQTSGSNVVTVTKVNGNTPGASCSGQFVRSIDSSARGTCNAISSTDLPANIKVRAFGYTFDGNGSALSSGVTKYLTVPFACTISAWNFAVDTGTATIKLWKVATTGTAIPTVSNSISTSGVSIATGTAVHSTTVSDFTTTAISANDIIGFNLFAVSSATFVNFILECDQ